MSQSVGEPARFRAAIGAMASHARLTKDTAPLVSAGVEGFLIIHALTSSGHRAQSAGRTVPNLASWCRELPACLHGKQLRHHRCLMTGRCPLSTGEPGCPICSVERPKNRLPGRAVGYESNPCCGALVAIGASPCVRRRIDVASVCAIHSERQHQHPASKSRRNSVRKPCDGCCC